jgi:predicted membrane protein
MKINLDHISIAVICIGLGLILLFEEINLFPWILLIIGVSQLPKIFFRENKITQIQKVLWLCGLAALFIYGIFWPGILILLGVSIILDGFKQKSYHKPRRTKINTKTEYKTYD